MGSDDIYDTFDEVMVFKHFEGFLEAAPQLVLQTYIIIRNGLCLQEWGGKCTKKGYHHNIHHV